MATVHKIPSGKWRAEVKVKAVRKSKVFAVKRDAIVWGLKTEEALRTGTLGGDITIGEVMEQYRRKVTPTKRGAVFEDRRLRFYQRDAIASKRLATLKCRDFEAFVQRRLTVISPRTGRTLTRGTLARDMTVISAVVHWSMRQGYLKTNPLDGFKWPVSEPHRERIATPEEIENICFVAGWEPHSVPQGATQMTAAAFCLSCETGMRAGEILAIERSWINGRVLTIPAQVTKTQQPRKIPLSNRAAEILDLVEKAGIRPRMFGLAISSRESLWHKIQQKAGLGEVLDSEGHVIKEALRFHDGRATFCTNAAKKISVLDLARITGHRDLKMLMKYYRPTAEELVKKL